MHATNQDEFTAKKKDEGVAMDMDKDGGLTIITKEEKAL